MKNFFLLTLFILPLFLLGCNNNSKTSLTNASDFDMSDCIKGCKMLGNGGNSKLDMDEYCRTLCDVGEAIESNDSAKCDKMDGFARETCYISIASETKDHSICKKVSDSMMQYGCYSSIAEELKDPSICKGISDKTLRTICEDAAN